MNKTLPPSVNWHLWTDCNMRCKFCFATFADVRKALGNRPSLNKAANMELAKILGSSFAKVSVAGGEAPLCPYIVEVFSELKRQGTTTALITNGARLMDDPALLLRLAPYLDWLGLSIDSFIPATQVALGRAVKNGRSAYSPEQYLDLAKSARSLGIGLKINTVVNRLNLNEDMVVPLIKMSPERWKLFQVLPIEGQNDGRVDDLLITEPEFLEFAHRHQSILGSMVVAETNDDMTGSYAMINPAGQFFDNVTGSLRCSLGILDVGMEAAWDAVDFDLEKLKSRGGIYEWNR